MSLDEIAFRKGQLSSPDDTLVLESIRYFSDLLFLDMQDPEVCAVVGVVPNIARICERHQNAVICYEATRCLARTACGGDSAATAAVLAAGMFPRFMSHVTLRSAMDEPTGSMVLCEDALLALCKICELGRAERDLAVAAGILPKLTDILTQASRNTERAHGGVCIRVLRNTAYCAVVLFEERPELFFDGDLKGLLLSLVGLIRLDDKVVQRDVVCALSEAAIGGHEASAAFIAETANISDIVVMARDASLDISLRQEALRLLGGLVSRSDIVTQAVVAADGINALFDIVLEHDVLHCFQNNALWALSNITAGTTDQILAVLTHTRMQDLCMCILSSSCDNQKEGMFALANACQRRNFEVLDKVVSCGGIDVLVGSLRLDDDEAKSVALNGLVDIFTAMAKCGRGARSVEALEAAGGIDALGMCLHSENPTVRGRARRVLDAHGDICFVLAEGASECAAPSPSLTLGAPPSSSPTDLGEPIIDVPARRLSACAVCGQSAGAGGAELLVCSRCQGVAYCSAACQKKDWKARHKAACGV